MTDLFSGWEFRHFRQARLNDRGCQHNGHGVVQNGFPEDQHVQDGLNIQSLEDGQSSHRIDGRYQTAERETFDETWKK